MSNHLYGKKFQKCKTNKCINNRKISSGGFLGFGYARCWAINKHVTIKDESGRTYPNKANTFLRRSTMDVLVVLV